MAKLVYFEDINKYAIQKGFWIFTYYLDLSSDSRVWWWSKENKWFKSCLGDKNTCENKYYEIYPPKIKTKTPKIIKLLGHE